MPRRELHPWLDRAQRLRDTGLGWDAIARILRAEGWPSGTGGHKLITKTRIRWALDPAWREAENLRKENYRAELALSDPRADWPRCAYCGEPRDPDTTIDVCGRCGRERNRREEAWRRQTRILRAIEKPGASIARVARAERTTASAIRTALHRARTREQRLLRAAKRRSTIAKIALAERVLEDTARDALAQARAANPQPARKAGKHAA